MGLLRRCWCYTDHLQAEDGGAIPFNTQFFQDDDDGPGFDDVDESGEGPITAGDEEQELLNSSRGPTRRVRPEFVNYAKRAKRVDVRRLKDNIWNNLDIIVPEPKEEADAMVVCFLAPSLYGRADHEFGTGHGRSASNGPG